MHREVWRALPSQSYDLMSVALSLIQLAAGAAFAPSVSQRPRASQRHAAAARIVLQAPPPSPPVATEPPPTRVPPAWGERASGFNDVAKSQADAYWEARRMETSQSAYGDYRPRAEQPAVAPSTPVAPELSSGGASDVVSARSQADAYVAHADVVSARSQADAYVARASAYGDYRPRAVQPAVAPARQVAPELNTPVAPELSFGGASDVVSARSQADAYVARAGVFGAGQPAASELEKAPAESITPELASGGVSGVLGFCSGKACRAFGDAAALGLGATFVFITLLSRAGYLTINYAKVEGDLFSLLNTNKGAPRPPARPPARPARRSTPLARNMSSRF